MPLFGAHLSIAGGHHNALLQAQALGCDTVQLFTKQPSQWSARPITNEQAHLFRSTLRKSGLRLPIAHDSYLETAHRELMRCYARSGERGMALRQYQTLRTLLDDELGAPPAAETTALFERLRQGDEI